MRLGINLFSMDPDSKVGSATFAFGLIRGILQNSNADVILFVKEKYFNKYNKQFKNNNIRIISIKDNILKKSVRLFFLNLGSAFLYYNSCKFLYKDFSDIINSTCDILYTPTTVIFPLDYQIKTVVSLHDIQHIHFPENFNRTTLRKRKVSFGITVSKCDFFHCSTNFIKQDLIKNLNIQANKIFVIPPGIDLEAFKFENKVNVKLDNYFLYPAQTWKHKNHLIILKALNFLKEKINLKFYFTGSDSTPYFAEIREYINKFNLQNNCKHLGYLSRTELMNYYINSKFIISAAEYEAASFPIFEAIALGKPVVASNIPSNFEFSSIFDLNLFDTQDPEGLAKLIYKICSGEINVNKQIKKNSLAITQFDWRYISKKFLKIISNITAVQNNLEK